MKILNCKWKFKWWLFCTPYLLAVDDVIKYLAYKLYLSKTA